MDADDLLKRVQPDRRGDPPGGRYCEVKVYWRDAGASHERTKAAKARDGGHDAFKFDNTLQALYAMSRLLVNVLRRDPSRVPGPQDGSLQAVTFKWNQEADG